jgi:hypothetical protein
MKKPKKLPLSVRVPADVLQVLRQTAEQRGMTMTAIAELAIHEKCREIAQLPPVRKATDK